MARYLNLANLCGQPEEARDQEWEKAFLQALIDGNLELENQDAMQGPDGWPYLFGKVTPSAQEPFLKDRRLAADPWDWIGHQCR